MKLETPRPMPADLDSRLERAGRRLRELPGLVAAVAFGSVARGTAQPWSDVDIGLLAEAAPGPETLADLEADLGELFGRPVDVVDLRRAPLPLRGRAVQEGKMLAQEQPAAWQDFVTRTTIHWLDYKPLYERAVRLAVRRLAGRGGAS